VRLPIRSRRSWSISGKRDVTCASLCGRTLIFAAFRIASAQSAEVKAILWHYEKTRKRTIRFGPPILIFLKVERSY